MSGPFTARSAVHAIKAEALSIHKAKAPKYHLRAGPDYLFWNCSKLTSNRAHAWKGTIEQARACRRTFAAAAGCKAVAIQPFPMLVGSVDE